MTRKKLPDNIKRSNKLSINLNNQQLEDLKKIAFEENSTVAGYIRDLIVAKLKEQAM